MEIISWVPALTTTGLLAMVIWLFKNLILTRLKNSVEHEFNTKLEALHAQIRESEERLKAELRAKEAEIEALRNGALTALTSRHIALDKRRIEAVDQLWSAITELAIPARNNASLLSNINLEKAAQRVKQDLDYRQKFELFGPACDVKNLDVRGAKKARPYLSPMIWALYSAYEVITMHEISIWHFLKSGLGDEILTGNESIYRLIKKAMPDLSDFVDKSGPKGYSILLELLESRLLQELQKLLSGVETDKESINQAAVILRLSDEAKPKAKSHQIEE